MNEETFKSIADQLRQPKGDQAIDVGEKMNTANLQMNRYTNENLKLEANDTVLEIGMGNGFFVKDLFAIQDNIHYTGCDFSEIMVTEACKLNGNIIEKEKARFICIDAGKLPFGDQSFDKIFTINTIYFWDDVKAVLSELKRVLKVDGQLLITVRPKYIMDNFPVAKYGFTTFSKEDITEILETNGFEVIENIEKKEEDLIFFGEVLKNEFIIIKAIQKLK